MKYDNSFVKHDSPYEKVLKYLYHPIEDELQISTYISNYMKT